MRARGTALLLSASAVYLYLLLFYLPFTPIYVDVDAATFLADSVRMLHGRLPYRDFFEFVPAGTDLVFYPLFKVFGPRVWIPDLLLLLMGVAFAWLALAISRRVVGPSLVLLPGLLFVFIAYAGRLDPTHHWFSGLALAGALAVLIEKRTLRRILLAGALCGLAATFTLNRGFLGAIGVGVFLVWDARRRKSPGVALLKQQLSLFATFLATYFAVNGYFIWKAGFGRFWSDTVVFGMKYFPADAGTNTFRVFLGEFPPVPPWNNLPSLMLWLFIHGLVPLIYLLFFIRYWRRSQHRSEQPWDRLMLLAIVGLFLFLSVAPAPAVHRICAGALPAFVILGWFLDTPHRLDRALTRLLWVGTISAAILLVAVRQSHWRAVLETPNGRLAMLHPEIYEQSHWVRQHTRPGEYFFEASTAHSYFWLDLRNPTPVPFVNNTEYSRPEQVAAVVQSLETHRVRYVLWSPEDLDEYAPWSGPAGDHLGPLRSYLYTHYHLARTFANGKQIWQRNE